MRLFNFSVVLGLSSLLFLAACRATVPTTGEPMRIGIYNYPGYGPLYVAEEKGFFEKEGVKVELVLQPDEDLLVSSFASGQSDMIGTTADQTVVMAAAGIPAVQVAAFDIGYCSDGILVKSDVQSIADLKGKTVYLSRGNPSHFLLRYFTKQAGLASSDVTISNMTADQVGAAFIAGKLDYGVSWEPWLSKAKERKDGKLLKCSSDAEGIIIDTLDVRRDVLERRRADVTRVVRALIGAIAFAKSNPAEANAIMAKRFEIPVEEYNELMKTVKLHGARENVSRFDATTKLSVQEVNKLAEEIFTEDGVLENKVDLNSLVDDRLPKEAALSLQ